MKTIALFCFILIGLTGKTQTVELYGLLYNEDPNPSLTYTEIITKDILTGQNNVVQTVPYMLPLSSPLARAVINPNDSTYNAIAQDVSVDSMYFLDHSYLFRTNLQTGATQTIEVDNGVHYMEYSCEDNAFYLLHFDYNTDSMLFSKIDAATNNYSIIAEYSTISLTTFSNSSGLQGSAFDPYKGHFYFHGHDIPEIETERRIYTLDVSNGAIVNSHLITAGTVNDINQLAFSTYDSTLYALKANFAPNERSLVKVDPDTWNTTTVSDPYDFWLSVYNPGIITPDGLTYIIPGGQVYGSQTVNFHSFNLTSGTHTESDPFFINPGNSQYLAFQCADREASLEDLYQFECDDQIQITTEANTLIVNSNNPVQSINVYNSLGQLCFSQYDVSDQQISIPIHSNGAIYFVRVEGEHCLSDRKVWMD